MAVDRRSVEMLLFAFLARYMIRPLCKQVWGMTAYLDLSSTGGPRLSSYWEVSCRPSSNTFRLAPSHVLPLIFSISHQILSTSHLARLPVIAFPMTGYFDWNQDYDSGGVAHAIRFMLLILWQMRMIPKILSFVIKVGFPGQRKRGRSQRQQQASKKCRKEKYRDYYIEPDGCR